ncbi:MAG: hypothetical protein AAB737_00315 [Patescibacteria group bacterium]
MATFIIMVVFFSPYTAGVLYRVPTGLYLTLAVALLLTAVLLGFSYRNGAIEINQRVYSWLMCALLCIAMLLVIYPAIRKDSQWCAEAGGVLKGKWKYGLNGCFDSNRKEIFNYTQTDWFK